MARDEDDTFSLLDAATYARLKALQADAETDGEAKSIALLAILQLLEEGTLLDF